MVLPGCHVSIFGFDMPDTEWGALTGCWFSGSLAPTLLETVVVASPGLLLDSGGSGRLDDLA